MALENRDRVSASSLFVEVRAFGETRAAACFSYPIPRANPEPTGKRNLSGKNNNYGWHENSLSKVIDHCNYGDY